MTEAEIETMDEEDDLKQKIGKFNWCSDNSGCGTTGYTTWYYRCDDPQRRDVKSSDGISIVECHRAFLGRLRANA